MSTLKIEVTSVDVRRSEKPLARARAYVFEEGESIMDNLMNRHSRPVELYRMALQMALVDAGVEGAEELKMTWSQKAGCSCGCSPGFLIEGMPNKEVYVDVRLTYTKEKPAEVIRIA